MVANPVNALVASMKSKLGRKRSNEDALRAADVIVEGLNDLSLDDLLPYLRGVRAKLGPNRRDEFERLVERHFRVGARDMARVQTARYNLVSPGARGRLRQAIPSLVAEYLYWAHMGRYDN